MSFYCGIGFSTGMQLWNVLKFPGSSVLGDWLPCLLLGRGLPFRERFLESSGWLLFLMDFQQGCCQLAVCNPKSRNLGGLEVCWMGKSSNSDVAFVTLVPVLCIPGLG